MERLEEVDGGIPRIINYYFCPDTRAYAAAALGMGRWSNGYHQDGETLSRMIARAGPPWA